MHTHTYQIHGVLIKCSKLKCDFNHQVSLFFLIIFNKLIDPINLWMFSTNLLVKCVLHDCDRDVVDDLSIAFDRGSTCGLRIRRLSSEPTGQTPRTRPIYL